MANTQKEKLNSRQIKIKSNLEFGVINPLRYDVNKKVFDLKIDDTLDIDDLGRLTVTPYDAPKITDDLESILDPDSWKAKYGMPPSFLDIWIRWRNDNPTQWKVINDEKIDTDGIETYLLLDVSKAAVNENFYLTYIYNLDTVDLYRFDIIEGFTISSRMNFVSFTSSAPEIVDVLQFMFYTSNPSVPGYDATKFEFAIKSDNKIQINCPGTVWNYTTIDIDPRGFHNWKVIGYTSGSNSYLQLWMDSILIASTEVTSFFGTISNPNLRFGMIVAATWSVWNIVIQFVDLTFNARLTIPIVGRPNYEWIFDYLIINKNQSIIGNLSIGGNLSIIGSITISPLLTGIIKSSAGVLSAITIGTALQVLRVNAAGTEYEYRTLVIDDMNDVIINTPITGDVLKYNGANWINDKALPYDSDYKCLISTS